MTDVPCIESVEAAAYAIPTDAPEADGTLSWEKTTVVTASVSAGGERGLGWTYAGAAAAPLISDVLASVVTGREATDPRGANAAMARAVRNIGRPGVAATAISAVDVALWDLYAKLLGTALHRLLGGGGRPVEVYGSGGFTTYDDQQTASQVAAWLEQGVGAVKIKIGESWGTRVERDLYRVELVRRLVGDDHAVFVDANGAYHVGQAIRVGERLDSLGVTWFEEPVSSDDLDGLRAVRAAVKADVTAGEYGYDLPYFGRMVSAQAVDCLQIDATRCGGITEFLRAAAVAGAHGFDVSAHCAPHLHAAFVGVLPNLRHIEYFHDHTRIEEQLLFEGAEPARNGELVPAADRSGHGLALRPDIDRWRTG